MPGACPPEAAMTYHDPCYLARVNGVHQPPRDLLKLASDAAPHRHRFPGNATQPREDVLLWCGRGAHVDGGGPKKRVCSVRAKEALDTGAKTVAVGCPFCLTMMTDGVAAQTSQPGAGCGGNPRGAPEALTLRGTLNYIILNVIVARTHVTNAAILSMKSPICTPYSGDHRSSTALWPSPGGYLSSWRSTGKALAAPLNFM